MPIQWGAATAASRARDDGVNQDALGVIHLDAGSSVERRPTVVACLADGMGGLDVPAETSSCAISAALGIAVASVGMNPALAVEMVVAANQAVLSRAAGRETGSALTCAVIEDSHVSIGHVGDTRLFHISDTACEILTADHSRLAERLGDPHPTRDVVKTQKGAKNLAKSLGEKPFGESFVHGLIGDNARRLAPGDLLVMCSDGVWTEVDDEEIVGITRAETVNDAAHHLVALALERDDSDDVSAIVIAI